jgi:hypothetical protein
MTGLALTREGVRIMAAIRQTTNRVAFEHIVLEPLRATLI